ncbi:MAG TPA: outer membrane beta-barrel protein [Stellaceae bacterium]|jgi:outer membrane protein OmpA-like peptidoglycan-associated protein|nr:outer membrane beta-barrel protein [Stellaceae bacterium]
MRFSLTGAAAALLLASFVPSGAQAQMVMGATNWTGFYLGANVGGAWGTGKESFNPALPGGHSTTGDINIRGPFGGGTAGFNWGSPSGFVWGIEGDIDGTGIGGSKNCPGAAPGINCGVSNSWQGTVRGRLGWAPGAGNLLWFVTGGAAFGDINAVGGAPVVHGSNTEVGWTAGAGAEYMFAPQWSAKLEYRHVDLGSDSFACPAASCGVATSVKASYNNDAILAGLNFHFGAPPPPPPAPAALPAPPPAAAKVFIVFFDWDRDTITPEGQAIIQQAADAYRAGAPVQIQVTGYTDRSGSPGYNQRLSERRANNVARALAALGVPKTQMAVSGRGENDNRVPTAPGVREPQNRRVEIVAP